MHFGKALKSALKKANMSQSEFAREFGVSRQRVNLMLQQETVYADTLYWVVKALPDFNDSNIQVRDKGDL